MLHEMKSLSLQTMSSSLETNSGRLRLGGDFDCGYRAGPSLAVFETWARRAKCSLSTKCWVPIFHRIQPVTVIPDLAA